MKALIIGATGATGTDLTHQLLDDPNYNEVTVFVRRSTGIKNPKLKEVITDFDNLPAVSPQITGDVLFSCLGTTLKVAGSKERQAHIDYEIPLHFAELARKNDVSSAVLLSAYGADSASRIFYSRLKGDLERDMGLLGFPTLIIFRPGLLLRDDTDRTGEKVYAAILKLLNRVGLLRSFKPLPTGVLAGKMVKASLTLKGRHVISLSGIFSF